MICVTAEIYSYAIFIARTWGIINFTNMLIKCLVCGVLYGCGAFDQQSLGNMQRARVERVKPTDASLKLFSVRCQK